MLKDLLSSKDKNIVRRIPTNSVFENIIQEFLDENNKKLDITRVRGLSNKIGEMKELIDSLQLPFDPINDSEMYELLVSSRFGDSKLQLIAGENYGLLGKLNYSSENSFDAEYAFRKKNMLTIGYLHKKPFIDGNRIGHHKDAKKYEIILPEEYNTVEVFNLVEERFNNNLSRSIPGMTIVPRDAINFGKILANNSYKSSQG